MIGINLFSFLLYSYRILFVSVRLGFVLGLDAGVDLVLVRLVFRLFLQEGSV